MRIDYPEGYVEISRSRKMHHVNVIVASRQPDNPLELVVNTAEIPLTKFIESYKEIVGPIMAETKSVENGDVSISDDEPSN